MWAQRRMRRRRGLMQRRARDLPVLDLDDGADRVEAGGLEPHLRPGLEVPPGRLLEGRQEIGQLRVAVLMPAEVLVEALEESVLADPRDELAQRRRALLIRDGVEVQVH